jgi:predicted nucleic acid-binding protein
MRVNEPIFVDVNIVMYAAGAKHPDRQACQAALNRIVNEEQPAYSLWTSLGRPTAVNVNCVPR